MTDIKNRKPGLALVVFLLAITTLRSFAEVPDEPKGYYRIPEATGNPNTGFHSSAFPESKTDYIFADGDFRSAGYFSSFELVCLPDLDETIIYIHNLQELKADDEVLPNVPLRIRLVNGTVLEADAKYEPYNENDEGLFGIFGATTSYPELIFHSSYLRCPTSSAIRGEEAMRQLCIYDIAEIHSVPELKITNLFLPGTSSARAFRGMCEAINNLAKEMGLKAPYPFTGNLPDTVHSAHATASPSPAGHGTERNGKITEPTSEISVKEMITKPLGLVAMKDSIWDIKFGMLLNEAERRNNWDVKKMEIEGKVTQFTIYGNHSYDAPEKEEGYNRTYRGEPAASVIVDAGYPWGENGPLESIQYGWSRAIKGKVPKYDRYRKEEVLAQRSWTEAEAKAFANAIVDDLRALGISMREGFKHKGDIYDMCGFNDERNTLYNVRIYKGDDSYSAFYYVTLEIIERNHYRFKKELKKEKK